MREPQPDRIGGRLNGFGWPLLVPVVLLPIYVATLLPGVAGYGDIAKFQFVGNVLGTPHATGYPTYVLLTNVYSRLVAIGSLAYRMNLFSALCTVCAGVVLFLICVRVYSVRAPIALAAAIGFGLMQEVWRSSLSAEVYTLHLLFMTMMLYGFLRWSKNRNLRWFLLGGFIYAVSFGNHMTAITLLPALLWLTFATDWRVIRSWKMMLTLILFILLGAAQYLYLPARFYAPDTTYLEAQAGDLSTLWYYVTGAQFKWMFFCFSLSQVLNTRIPLIGGMIVRDMSWALIPTMAGVLLMRPIRISIGLLIGTAGVIFFCINYGTYEINTYLIPAYMLLSIPMAIALNRLYESVPSFGKAAAAVVIVVLPIYLFWHNYAIVDQSHNTLEATQAEQILAAAHSRALIIPSNYDTLERLWYYVIGEKYQQKQLYVLHRFKPDELYDYLKNGTPFYLPEQRLYTPPGLAIYCMASGDEAPLKDTGLIIAQVNSLLYRVELPEE